jgi:putative phosphoesterase
MRIAVVSDIHGNRAAFQAVLADLRETSPDLVFHGGDLAQGGSHPSEIIDQIRSLGWPGVQGNTDEVLWAPQSLPEMPSLLRLRSVIADTIAVSSVWISDEQKQWLKSLPRIHCQENFAVVHASPDSLWRSPLADATDEELETTYGSLNARVVVYGHIHRPYIRALHRFTVANSGSVSLSYDGDLRASYLLIDDLNPSIRRVAYDVETEIRELKESGLPHAEWIARVLRAGKFVSPEP